MRLSQKLIDALVAVVRAELTTELVRGFYLADKSVRNHFETPAPEWVTLDLLESSDPFVNVFEGSVVANRATWDVRVAIRFDNPGEVLVESAPEGARPYTRQTKCTVIELIA